MTRYPIAADYAQAAADPAEFFSDEQLATLDWVHRQFGLPVGIKGSSAVVFQGLLEGGKVAVRCLTSPPNEGRLRYQLIGEHVSAEPGTPFAKAEWRETAVCVDSEEYPLVLMEWVEGLQLDDYVERNLHDPERLEQLVGDWTALIERLAEEKAAHGDLQHGNVMVGADGGLRLVDLDGVWIPSLAELSSRERGHPNYQHPGRDVTHWGPTMDGFSALVVDVSLRAIARDPDVWSEFNDSGTNLIFSKLDFEAVAEGRADERPLLQRVGALAGDDEELTAAFHCLLDACALDAGEVADPIRLLRRRQAARPQNVWPPTPTTPDPEPAEPEPDGPRAPAPLPGPDRRMPVAVILAIAVPLLLGIIASLAIYLART